MGQSTHDFNFVATLLQLNHLIRVDVREMLDIFCQIYRINNKRSSVNYIIKADDFSQILYNISLQKTSMRFCQILFIALLILLAGAQSCLNTQDSSLLLQTGRIQVINSNSPQASRLHSYSIPITYIVPLSGFNIAASISGLALSNQFQNSFDFTVRGGRGSSASTAQIVVFITDDSSWTSLQVSYLISSRSDLFLGSFIADGYIFQSTSSNVLTLSYGIPNWVSTSAIVRSVTEFAGLRTFLSQPLNISFVSSTVNATTGLIRVVINTNTAFELLYLTYYWWITGASDIVFSDYNLNDGSTLAYTFVGLEAINGTRIVYAGSGFNRVGLVACNGDRCPNSCVNTNTCVNLKGVQSNVACYLCGPNQVFSNNNCVNAFVCGPRQTFNGTACLCSRGYISVNGACQPSCGTNAYVNADGICQCISSVNCNQITTCQANQILVGGTCICEQGFVLVNGACIIAFPCPTGTVWNPPSQSCICINPLQYLSNGVCISCISNSAWNGTRCNCNTGFQLINGVCSTCPPNTAWNGNVCACIASFYLINGVCSQCQPNSAWNGTSCNCLSGFNLINGSCIACPTNSVWVASQKNCVCLSGFYMVNGVCIACPTGSFWNGTACVCITGILVNNTCIQCPPFSTWNGNNCSCIANYYLINGVCAQCPINTAWNGNACVCVANYFLINGVCTQCQPNSVWNGSACNCLSGFNLVNGACIACQPFSVWVQAQNACVCISGYFLVNGSCITCPANSGWNGTTCVCLAGFVSINNACSKCPANTVSNGTSCVCATGFFNVSGSCQQQPPNTYFNGTAFVCNNFYVLVNGVCTSCPPNATWNGSSCVCPKNFNFYNGQCIRCPARSKWTGTECKCNQKNQFLINNNCSECPPNSAWGGQSCICINGYYPSGGFCLSCGPNSFWNGISCTCQFGVLVNGACTNITSCGENSAWDGTKCACLQGFYLLDGSCQACPDNTTYNGLECVPNCPTKAFWNGSQCVCQIGFYLIQNSCLPCDPNSVYVPASQTCVCNSGYFGNFQLCTQCDPSCQTCSQSGPKNCLSCPAGSILNGGSCTIDCGVGQTLINGKCVGCPSNCIKCSSALICTQCAPNYNLKQQVISSGPATVCQLPAASGPRSLLALKGVVVGNNVIYQGLSLSTLPAFFLTTNCQNCADLFLVSIEPNLGISYAISFVLNSQYWFIIEFNYGFQVNPTFNYTVKLNPKYTSYFTAADMAQSASNGITTAQYPQAPALSNPTAGGTRSNPRGQASAANNPKTANTTNPANNANTPLSSSQIEAIFGSPLVKTEQTRSVSQAGTVKQISATTLTSIFG